MRKLVFIYLLLLPLVATFGQGNLSVEEMTEKGLRLYEEKNYAEAVECFRDAAERGYAEAQYKLGVCYANGDGVERNYEKAVKWYRDAAEQGDAFAQINLGICYLNGRGVPKDVTEGLRWYHKAADQEHPVAFFNLGNVYNDGKYVKRDAKEAVKWWQKSADLGYPLAQYNLAHAYLKGEAVRKDEKKAIELLNAFFSNNQPKDFKLLHHAEQPESGFVVGEIQTTSGTTYRVNVSYKAKGNQAIIQSIRIE